MVDDGLEGFEADMAVADFFVAVLMAGQLVLAVIDMDGFQSFQADDLVKAVNTSSRWWTMS